MVASLDCAAGPFGPFACVIDNSPAPVARTVGLPRVLRAGFLQPHIFRGSCGPRVIRGCFQLSAVFFSSLQGSDVARDLLE